MFFSQSVAPSAQDFPGLHAEQLRDGTVALPGHPFKCGLTWTNCAQWRRWRKYLPTMPLHYVDPHKKHGRWYTALESFGRSRPGQFWARHFAPRIDPWLYRKTGGRYPWVLGGVSTAPLVTTGAKSSQRRESQITYFHDGPDPIVTARLQRPQTSAVVLQLQGAP